MRIRKNARILALSSAPPPQPISNPICNTSLCLLNQSPWDVIDFSPQSDDHFSFPEQYQVKINDMIMGRDVNGESRTASKSIGSIKRKWKVKKEEELEETKMVDAKKKMEVEKQVFLCTKTDGKKWKCKNETNERNSLCEHHLNLLRSYQYKYTHPRHESDVPKPLPVSRRRNKKSKPSTSSSGLPDEEFYYYSGFGPLWGRKRAVGRESECSKEDEEMPYVDQSSSSGPHSSSPAACSRDHFVVDYDSDDEDYGCGKKRTRSLKSLL